METVGSLLSLRPDQISEIFKSVDKNKNHQIEFSEFCTAALDQELVLQQRNLKQAFKALDIDRSSGISKDELRTIFVNCADDCSHIEDGVWQKIEQRVGLDSRGELKFNEFEAYMK